MPNDHDLIRRGDALKAIAGWEIPGTAIAALPAVTVGVPTDAAKIIQKRIDTIIAEEGSQEPDTGEVNLPEWAQTAVEELEGILAALEPQPAPDAAAIREADWQKQQRVDAMRRRHMNAPEDPHVAALCERYGYGAVMDAASRLWARMDSVGAFYIGGCIGLRSDADAAALITEKPHDRA